MITAEMLTNPLVVELLATLGFKAQYLLDSDVEDILANRLSANDACEIAYKRWIADQGEEADLNRVLEIEAASCRRVGRPPQSSIGPKRQGCKDHGFKSIGLAGSGTGRWSSERLHAVRKPA